MTDLNDVQKHVLAYMDEALMEEDIFLLEAWNQVKNMVIDSLGDEE